MSSCRTIICKQTNNHAWYLTVLLVSQANEAKYKLLHSFHVLTDMKYVIHNADYVLFYQFHYSDDESCRALRAVNFTYLRSRNIVLIHSVEILYLLGVPRNRKHSYPMLKFVCLFV